MKLAGWIIAAAVVVSLVGTLVESSGGQVWSTLLDLSTLAAVIWVVASLMARRRNGPHR
jgi:hypothetical protein